MFYMMKNKIAECITLIASKAISNPLRNCNIHQASLAALRRHPLPVTISNRFTSSFTIFQIFPVVSANPCPLPMDLWSQHLLRLHSAKRKTAGFTSYVITYCFFCLQTSISTRDNLSRFSFQESPTPTFLW